MTKFFFVTLFAHGLAIVHRNILIADAWLRIKFIQILVSYDLRRVEIIKKCLTRIQAHISSSFVAEVDLCHRAKTLRTISGSDMGFGDSRHRSIGDDQ